MSHLLMLRADSEMFVESGCVSNGSVHISMAIFLEMDIMFMHLLI